MKRNRLVILVSVLLLAVLIVAGVWWLRSAALRNSLDITTSGFIEATQVAIAPEIGGRITAITVDEGDLASAGATMVKLDDSLLKAQQAQAEAVVAQAQAAVEQAQAVVEQAQAVADQAAMSRNQVMATRDGTQKAWLNAVDVQQHPLDLDAQLVAAQGQVDIARSSLALAMDNYRKLAYPYSYATFAFDVPTAVGYMADAQNQIDAVRQKLLVGLTSDQYNAILLQLQQAMDNLNKGSSLLARGRGEDVFQSGILNVKDFWTVRAAQLQVDQAQSSLDTASKTLQIMREKKSNPQQINAAVDSARATYDSAAAAVLVAESAVSASQKQVAIAQKQVGVVQKQVEQARASLEVIRVQVGKMTIVSPISGTVATRNAEVGEVASPGVALLTIAALDNVTLTAYVPESRVGRVTLGQKALVSVDSYPGQTFNGTVSFISPTALFTPGNIQLKNEREKTVFPVKIKLANPDHKLKPGMPADTTIVVGP